MSVLYGDCYDMLEEALSGLDAASTCCVTDPPYEFKASGGGQLRKNRKYMDMIESLGLADGFDDSLLIPDYFASVVVFCHNDQVATLMGVLQRRYDQCALLVWRKSNPMPVHNKHYLPDLEIILHAWRKGAAPVGEYATLSRCIEHPVGRNEYDHPTQKPVAVMDRIVANIAAPVIVDPFCGTGTTGVAAVTAGKRFIGIEKNNAFFEVARDRVRAAQSARGQADEDAQ